MNNSRKSRSFPSQVCDTWADLLAFTPEEQLSPADLAAFIEHVKTCPVCAALREDYRLLTTYTRRALSVTPLSDLPASVLAEMQRASSVVGGAQLRVLPPQTGRGQRTRTIVQFPRSRRVGVRMQGRNFLRLKPLWSVAISLVVLVLASFAWFGLVGAASLSWQKTLVTLRPGATAVHMVSWSPDGKDIAVLWDDSTLQVLDAYTYRPVFSQTVELGYGLAWSPDSRYLASIGRTDNTIQIWDLATRQCAVDLLHRCLIYTGHGAQINAIAWSPSGRYIASASDDQTAQVWDAHSMKRLYTYQDPGSKVTKIAWSPDGRRLAVGDDNNHLQAWDALTGAHVVHYISGHPGSITFVGWSPDGNALFSASSDGAWCTWNAQTGGSVYVNHFQEPIFAADIWWAGNTGYIALVSGVSVQIWQIKDQPGKLLAPAWLATYAPDGPGQRDNILSLSWSPRGGQIIAGSGDVLNFRLGA